MANEVDDTMKRIVAYKGIVGGMIVNSEGVAIKSTLDNTTTVQYAALVSSLAERARNVVKEIDSSNDLLFLRLRSKKHEILITPDKEYIVICIQEPTD